MLASEMGRWMGDHGGGATRLTIKYERRVDRTREQTGECTVLEDCPISLAASCHQSDRIPLCLNPFLPVLSRPLLRAFAIIKL